MPLTPRSNPALRRRAGACAGLALVLSACSDDGGAGADASTELDASTQPDAAAATTSFISPDAWTITPEADDPLPDHRPATIDCPENAVQVESLEGEPAYVVNTQVCNYLSASQPSTAKIPAGATVRGRIWHFSLSLPDGGEGEAHIAIFVGSELAWEDTITIPSEGQLLELSWEPTEAVPEGTEITYHLHNHGENEWYLFDLGFEEP